jgi:hypothetical protein
MPQFPFPFNAAQCRLLDKISSKEGLMFTHIWGRDKVMVIDCVSRDCDQPIAQSPNIFDTRWHDIATNLLRFRKSQISWDLRDHVSVTPQISKQIRQRDGTKTVRVQKLRSGLSRSRPGTKNWKKIVKIIVNGRNWKTPTRTVWSHRCRSGIHDSWRSTAEVSTFRTLFSTQVTLHPPPFPIHYM